MARVAVVLLVVLSLFSIAIGKWISIMDENKIEKLMEQINDRNRSIDMKLLYEENMKGMSGIERRGIVKLSDQSKENSEEICYGKLRYKSKDALYGTMERKYCMYMGK